MVTLDAAPLAAQLIATKTKATADELGAQLGLKLPVDALTVLHEWGERLAWQVEPGVALLLAFIRRAVTGPEEFVFDRVKRSSSTTALLLAVRHGAKVTLGVARSFRSVRPSGGWPELAEGWRPKLADNRELLLAWAGREGGRDRLVFELTEQPRPSSPGDAETERSLLAAITAAPDDDAPRQVFADWALERGDARGELIRLQLLRDPSAEDKRRAAALLAASWKAMAGELAKWCGPNSFERGFVSGVSMTLAAFQKHGERLFTTWPLRRLHLDEPRFTPALLTKLANTAALDRVTSLGIAQASPAVTQFLPVAGLAGGERFARLEEVSFSACGHSGPDWEALFTTWKAPRLRRVELSFTRTHPALYRALARAKGLPALETITEYSTHTLAPRESSDWAAAYEVLLGRRSLKHLVLQTLCGGPRAALSLVRAKGAARLETLELWGVGCGDEFLEALLRSPHASTLTSLCLRGQGFSTAAASEVMKLPRLERLGFLGEWREGLEQLEAAFLAVPTSHPLRVIGLPTVGPSKKRLGRFVVIDRFS